jgi:hypothetical protein
MRAVASANVGHTNVYVPLGNHLFRKLGFVPIPLSMAWYSDGLAVVGGASQYKEHLGAHVMKIGAMTPEQVLAAVAPCIAHENETALRQQSPGLLQMWAVLRDRGGPGRRTLKFDLGKTWRRTVRDRDSRGCAIGNTHQHV